MHGVLDGWSPYPAFRRSTVPLLASGFLRIPQAAANSVALLTQMNPHGLGIRVIDQQHEGQRRPVYGAFQ